MNTDGGQAEAAYPQLDQNAAPPQAAYNPNAVQAQPQPPPSYGQPQVVQQPVVYQQQPVVTQPQTTGGPQQGIHVFIVCVCIY